MKNEEINISEFMDLLSTHNLKRCTIEITNVCPFFCDHCYIENSIKKFMSFEEYRKIIDQLFELNCNWILITGGEPFLNPAFNEMYIYAKKKGMFVSVNTNGYLLDKKILDVFKEYKPDMLEISMYGYDKDSYENFTHVGDSFFKVRENIKLIAKNNINLTIKTTLTKRNYQYINEIRKFADELSVPFRYDYIIFPKIENNDYQRNKESLTPKQIIDVFKQNENDVLYFKNAVNSLNEIKKSENKIKKVFQCGLGTDQIFIDCFSNIKPCLVVPIKYNINDYSIEKAIENIKIFKESLEFNKNSKCEDCYKRKICRYCPGRFFLETKSYTEAPDFYCELADLIIEEFK